MNVALSAIIVIVAFLIFIILTLKGVPQLLTVLLAVVLTCFATSEGFIESFFTTFLGGVGSAIQTILLLVLTGTMFGAAMSAAGCSDSIGQFLIRKIGAKNAPYVVIVVTFIAALSGMPTYVFVAYAVSVAVMSRANLPLYIAMTAMMGTSVVVCFCMPGFVGLQNLLPTMYIGTDLYAGSLIGWVCTILGMVLVIVSVRVMVKRAIKNGVGYTAPVIPSAPGAPGAPEMPEMQEEKRDLPNFFVAIFPIVLILVLCMVFQMVIGWDAMTSVIISQAASIAFIYLTNWRRIQSKLKPLMDGAAQTGEMILPVICLFGYATVLSTTPAYDAVLTWITTLNMNPYVVTVIAIAIIVGMCSDGNTGLIFFFSTMAPALLAANPGADPGVIHRLGTITATTVDSLPQNSSIYMTLRVFGYTHKNGYKYLFLATVVITSILAVVALIMALVLY